MKSADDDSVHIARVCLALCVLSTFRATSLLTSEVFLQLCAESSVKDWRHVPNAWWQVVGPAAASILFLAYFLAARRVLQRAAFALVMLGSSMHVCFVFWQLSPSAYSWVNIGFYGAIALFSGAAVASQLGELSRLEQG